MKKSISSKRLYNAFLKANLGDIAHYDCWTTVWAVRSKIWNDKALKKQARKALGDLVQRAITEGNSALFRQLADALDLMIIFERRPGAPLSADVFFAVEELNAIRGSFTRTDLLNWLNDEMDTGVKREELERELEHMDLADLIPD